MQSQTIKTPTSDDIKRGDHAARSAASSEFYVQKCEALVDQIQRICDVARAGEKVVLFDQWGETVTLVQYEEKGKTDASEGCSIHPAPTP